MAHSGRAVRPRSRAGGGPAEQGPPSESTRKVMAAHTMPPSFFPEGLRAALENSLRAI